MFFWEVSGICILQIQTTNALFSIYTTARKNSKSLTSSHLERMVFSFEILGFLETAYTWVCMSVMLLKEHFYRVLCSETVHKWFFHQMALQEVGWLMHIFIKYKNCLMQAFWMRLPCDKVYRNILSYELRLWDVEVDPGCSHGHRPPSATICHSV